MILMARGDRIRSDNVQAVERMGIVEQKLGHTFECGRLNERA